MLFEQCRACCFLIMHPGSEKIQETTEVLKKEHFYFWPLAWKEAFFKKRLHYLPELQGISNLYINKLFNIWSSISFALAELFICICCINGSGFEIAYLQWLLKPSEISLFYSCRLVQLQYFQCTGRHFLRANDISP